MALSIPIFLIALIASLAQCQNFLLMNRTGCGDQRSGKTCLFRPKGCNPDFDCTIGLIAYPVDSNHLRIEMVAATLIPHVDQQYIAIGFSKDPVMGDDAVTECVLNEFGSFSGTLSTEVFVSYNTPNKMNDRVYVPEDEKESLITDVRSQIVDGRLNCHFTQEIVPKSIKGNDGRVWSLNDNYYIFGATGSAQPDEINAHDTHHGSYYYPVMSPQMVNPTQNELFVVETAAPTLFPPSTTTTSTTTTEPTTKREQTTTRKTTRKQRRFNSSPNMLPSLFVLLSIGLLV